MSICKETKWCLQSTELILGGKKKSMLDLTKFAPKWLQKIWMAVWKNVNTVWLPFFSETSECQKHSYVVLCVKNYLVISAFFKAPSTVRLNLYFHSDHLTFFYTLVWTDKSHAKIRQNFMLNIPVGVNRPLARISCRMSQTLKQQLKAVKKKNS